MTRPHRSLAVVRASAPSQCAVCRDDRQVMSVRRGDDCGRITRCPHCSPTPGTAAMPIYIYKPYRGDLPEGVTA